MPRIVSCTASSARKKTSSLFALGKNVALPLASSTRSFLDNHRYLSAFFLSEFFKWDLLSLPFLPFFPPLELSMI